jgi:hypothetical protein
MINFAHSAHFPAPFCKVCLINGEGVNPEREDLLLHAKGSDGFGKILANGHALAIHDDVFWSFVCSPPIWFVLVTFSRLGDIVSFTGQSKLGHLAFDRAMSDMEDNRRCPIPRGHDTHDSDFVGNHVKWHISKVHGRRFDAGFRSQANRAYARQNNFLAMTTIPFLAPITPLSVEYLFEVAICD